MPGKVVLIEHMDGGRDDRVARHLSHRGFALHWCNPSRGDVLPAPGEEFAAAVVYGGVQSVNDIETHSYIRDELDWIQRWIADDRPYLGLCLGGQLLARALGAPVGPHPGGLHEIGFVPVRPTQLGKCVFPGRLHVYQWHNEGFEVPDGGELLATGEVYPNQAFRVARRAFGLQFHPETTAQMRNEWLDACAHMLNEPGVHDRQRQMADARRFDQPMADWLLKLVDEHLLPGD
ncbi:MAG: glutamine amidotransferase [Gammaproteobacteria bacterium]|nr:glutamine amidotransferase [Gammaproteobacteria bacterium]MDX2462076.1 glutamine amidotransferase [Gammaproteobacteria bacterium]